MSTSLASEEHFTVFELAERYKVSTQTIRRWFGNEPGVILFGSRETRFKRRRMTMRIPASVAERVHQRMQVRAG